MRLVGDTNTGREVIEAVVDHGLGDARVARIERAGGCEGKARGVGVGRERVVVKGAAAAVTVRGEEHGLVADAVVQRQLALEVPGVLRVAGEDVLAEGGLLRTALTEALDATSKEVDHALADVLVVDAGELAVEGVLDAEAEGDGDVEVDVDTDGVRVDAAGGRASVVTAARPGGVGGVDHVGREIEDVTKRGGLHALIVAGRSGQ